MGGNGGPFNDWGLLWVCRSGKVGLGSAAESVSSPLEGLLWVQRGFIGLNW